MREISTLFVILCLSLSLRGAGPSAIVERCSELRTMLTTDVEAGIAAAKADNSAIDEIPLKRVQFAFQSMQRQEKVLAALYQYRISSEAKVPDAWVVEARQSSLDFLDRLESDTRWVLVSIPRISLKVDHEKVSELCAMILTECASYRKELIGSRPQLEEGEPGATDKVTVTWEASRAFHQILMESVERDVPSSSQDREGIGIRRRLDGHVGRIYGWIGIGEAAESAIATTPVEYRDSLRETTATCASRILKEVAQLSAFRGRLVSLHSEEASRILSSCEQELSAKVRDFSDKNE